MKAKKLRPKTRRARKEPRLVTEAKASVSKAKSSKGSGVFSVPIYNTSGKSVGAFSFDKKIFTGDVNKKVLYQAILMYNANKRQGNASTKTRGDVSGGGKKPWRQKGTGRARAGSTRSPLWRHGGVIFGPHPRDYHFDIPKKIKTLAFLSSINSKLNDKKVIGIEEVRIEEPKTKKFKAIVDALKLEGKSLFVLGGIDENIKRSSNNLREVSVRNYNDFSTMDVLTSDNLVMSKTALEKLPGRFK